jgi:gamma-glutamyl phosphate reductase
MSALLGDDFEATSRLIEGLQLALTQLRRYGPDHAQDIVTACEEAVADIVRELNGIQIERTPRG